MASSFTGDLVGRVLGGRYRLRSLIGNGASARVYLADDVKLRRRVAVKVLHASLAEDDAFLRRFQHEAEALAPLSHPNIVVVHDVNHGVNALGEPPYLVTEYLAGGSLRNVLDIGYRLSLSQATIVGLEAARGLQFAHARGLVHRDIKPANLLFGDDQRVRIADFGLARALADFGRTEPNGSPVGTTRYLSPEQARGVALDGRSDVYSLALVLIESVTGSVPFTADTWQGMAMARMDATLDPPEEMGVLVPVLEQAGALDPAQRLDAVRLVDALEQVARNLPRAERLPLDGSIVLKRGALLEDRDPTQHVTSIAGLSARPESGAGRSGGSVFDDALHQREGESGAVATGTGGPPEVIDLRAGSVLFDEYLDDDPPEVMSQSNRSTASPAAFIVAPEPVVDASSSAASAAATPVVKESRLVGRKARKAAAAAAAAAGSSTKPASSGAASEKRPKRRRRVVIAVVAAAVLLAGLFALIQARQVPTHPVPTLTNQTVAAARQQLAVLDIDLRAGDPGFSDTVRSGFILSQQPAAGQKLKEGATVVVQVSKGIKPVAVPTLSGLTLEGARALVIDRRLKLLSPPTLQASETVPEGQVIDWSPKGEQPPGTPVRVVMSSGLPTVVIPKVAGRSPDDAVQTLTALGLRTALSSAYSDVNPKGKVAFTSPKSTVEVKKGSTVTIFVSLGLELIPVPNVVGMTPADAGAALTKVGFRVSSTVGAPDALVAYTRPRRTTKLKRGSPIVLYTDVAPPDVLAATTLPPLASALPTTTKPTTAKPSTTKPSTTKTT